MPDMDSRTNPFVGPRAFVLGETLYGRDRELRELLDLLIAERIVLLYSPSGAGKSSLIQASLIPGLEAEGFQVMPLIRFNYEPPAVLGQKEGFNRYIFSAIQSLEDALPEGQRLPDEITSQMTLPEYLAQRTKGEGQPDTEVFIFDQFEEVLTVDVTDRAAKSVLFSQLGAVFRDRKRWALFSIREDFVGALSPYLRPIPTRFSNTCRLELLGREAARQAIQRPPAESGVPFQDEAAGDLVDDLRRTRIQHPDGTIEEQLGLFVEPVQLQVVCYRLWEHLPPDAAQITREHIESIGTVDTALADYYADRVHTIAGETGLSKRSIREWFGRQLITEQGLRGQILMEAESSGGLDNQAIHLLADAHLVRGEQHGGATWFELTHDRLIEPVQRDNALWMETHLSLLQRQAALWDSQGRPDALLLKDDVLQEAQRWATDHTAEMMSVDFDFLQDSRMERERQQAEKLARQAERQQRRNRLIVRFSAVAIALAIIAIILGSWAIIEKNEANRHADIAKTQEAIAKIQEAIAKEEKDEAEVARAVAEAAQKVADEKREEAEAAQKVADEKREEAETAQKVADEEKARAEQEKERAEVAEAEARSGRLAALSLNARDQQPDLACLLSLEALDAANTLEARSALLGEIQLALSRITSPISNQPPAQEVSLKDVALSADGTLMAFGGDYGLAKVLNVKSGMFTGMVRNADENNKKINAVALSPDGGTLFTGDEDGYVRHWDVQSGREVGKFTYTSGSVKSLAVSPDGSTLAYAGTGGQIYLKDAENILDEEKTKQISSGDSIAVVLSLEWLLDKSQDNTYLLAAGSIDGLLRVFEVNLEEDKFKIIFRDNEHEGKINSVAWSPSGEWLASGGVDNSEGKETTLILREWDDENRSVKNLTLIHHPQDVYGVAFSPDGKILAAGSRDGTLALYDVITRRKIEQGIDHNYGSISSVAFNTQGKPGEPFVLASVGVDKRVNLYEIATKNPLGNLFTDSKGSLRSLRFLPDQEILLLGGLSNVALLWRAQIEDLKNIKEERLFATRVPSAAAISADGKKVLLGYEDSTIDILKAQPDGTYTGPEIINLAAGPIYSLAIAPYGDTLAVGLCSISIEPEEDCENYEIQLWSISKKERKKNDPFPITGKVTSLAFSPKDNRLAAGTQDQKILFWTREDGGGYKLDPESQYQSGSGISSLAFIDPDPKDPDKHLLAVGTTLGDVLLLDVETLSPYGERFIGASGPVTALAFSSDSQVLASGSETGNVIFWDLNVDNWVDRACELADRNLTKSEWKKFIKLPESKYQRTCPHLPDG